MSQIVLLISGIISAVIFVPTVPIYLTLLYTQFKFRHKFPFTSTYFKLSFCLGLFDLIHLFNDWLIGMLHHFGLYDVISGKADVYAKQFSIVWWFSALGQKFAVLLLAVDRLSAMWFHHVSQMWNPKLCKNMIPCSKSFTFV